MLPGFKLVCKQSDGSYTDNIFKAEYGGTRYYVRGEEIISEEVIDDALRYERGKGFAQGYQRAKYREPLCNIIASRIRRFIAEFRGRKSD